MSQEILEDMHVHSTFSDGVNSITENLQEAEKVGLKKLCCVDHVRRETDWVSDFVKAIETEKSKTNIQIFSGLETKLL
ncbi:MAG: PHP domain-containing protein, partial [Pyrinomonadaceae bacterium]|nr:PHP domain-containing protein [Pyrinomonadaceae bacterium]